MKEEKDVMHMSYDELMDKANEHIEDACEKKDWTILRTGMRYLHLAINTAEAKGFAAMKILKGEQ